MSSIIIDFSRICVQMSVFDIVRYSDVCYNYDSQNII